MLDGHNEIGKIGGSATERPISVTAGNRRGPFGHQEFSGFVLHRAAYGNCGSDDWPTGFICHASRDAFSAAHFESNSAVSVSGHRESGGNVVLPGGEHFHWRSILAGWKIDGCHPVVTRFNRGLLQNLTLSWQYCLHDGPHNWGTR